MAKEFNRRDFLKVGALTLAAACVPQKLPEKDRHFHVEFDNNPEISFEEARGMALHYNKLKDQVPDPEIEASKENFANLMLEVVPNFQYEGIVAVTRYPKAVGFKHFINGEQHNHTLGVSNCRDYAQENYKYINEMSNRHDHSSWIPVAVHELVHVQQHGKCFTEQRNNVENTAQIVTLEIMSAMAMTGHDYMLYPLLGEMEKISRGTALSQALKTERLDDYEELLKDRVDHNHQKMASYKKAMRYWEGQENRLQQVVEWYAEEPLGRIIKAIKEDNNVIDDLALPETWNSRIYEFEQREIEIDDLAYFLEHDEDLVWAHNHE